MHEHTTKAIATLGTEAPVIKSIANPEAEAILTKAVATVEHVETLNMVRVAVVEESNGAITLPDADENQIPTIEGGDTLGRDGDRDKATTDDTRGGNKCDPGSRPAEVVTKPLKFADACANPNAKPITVYGLTGPVNAVNVDGTLFIKNDEAEAAAEALYSKALEPASKVAPVASEVAPTPKPTPEPAAALDSEPSCSVAPSSAISYSAAASKPPVGPKPSAAAFQLRAKFPAGLKRSAPASQRVSGTAGMLRCLFATLLFTSGSCLRLASPKAWPSPSQPLPPGGGAPQLQQQAESANQERFAYGLLRLLRLRGGTIISTPQPAPEEISPGLKDAAKRVHDATVAFARAKERADKAASDASASASAESSAQATFDAARSAQEKASALKEKSDKVKELKDILDAANTALTAFQVAMTLASSQLAVATAALVAAAASNWIPFLDFGPSEVATAAAGAEETEASATEAGASTALGAAKASAEAAETAYETAASEEATLAKGVEGAAEGEAKAAIEADLKMTKAETALTRARNLNTAAQLALKATALTAATDAYEAALKSFGKAHIEKLIEKDLGWQAFQGLDRMMRDHPFDGNYDPNDDDDNDEDQKCPADGGPDFFGALEEGTQYTFLVALSGLCDDFQSPGEESQSVWTMCAVEESAFTFYQELMVILDAFGIPIPDCLGFQDILDGESPVSPHVAAHPISLMAKPGSPGVIKKIKKETGFKFTVGCINLGGKPIYNVDGSSVDHRFREGGTRFTGWLSWWKHGVTIGKMLKLAGGADCGCRIELPAGHTHNDPLNPKYLVGGHMDIDDIDKSGKYWAMLPICKRHNSKKFDRYKVRMTCKPKAMGLKFDKFEKKKKM